MSVTSDYMADLPSGYVGFFNLPVQAHRKSARRGFDFTLMVVGESGLGKSTLINCLFKTDLYENRMIPTATERIHRTVNLESSYVEIEERGVRLRLTIVDTPGFGDALRNEDCSKPILQYIDEQFERYLRDESSLNRRNIIDSRVHCCFYFISPFGHGLKPLDLEVLRLLYSKVNIVPIIAKADTLTRKEQIQMKRRVMQELEENDIRIYVLPSCDPDEDEEYLSVIRQLKAAFPFAVCSSVTRRDGDLPLPVRQYPWGAVEVENPDHSDFVHLRTMLIMHMQDLKEATNDHYENYRSIRLSASAKFSQLDVVDKISYVASGAPKDIK